MIPHLWTHSVDKKSEFTISFVSIVAISMVSIVRGVVRLDGARDKKQVWCPHVRTNEVFPKQMHWIEESTCDIVGTFGAPRN